MQQNCNKIENSAVGMERILICWLMILNQTTASVFQTHSAGSIVEGLQQCLHHTAELNLVKYNY